MKRKRLIYELRWDDHDGWWKLYLGRDEVLDYELWHPKRAAEREARIFCRNTHEARGIPTQLLIYRKDGKITRGGRSEASYGVDSRSRG